METINSQSQHISTSELVERAKSAVQPQNPEKTEEPPQVSYTIEDYVDSLEELKRAKRFLAKAYEKYETGQMIEDGETATVDRATISKNRPHWEEHFPKDDSSQEQAKWQEFVLSIPDSTTQDCLRYLYRVSKKHEEVGKDPAVEQQRLQHSQEMLEIMRHAAAFRHLELEELAIVKRIESLQAQAVVMGESSWHNQDQLRLLESQIATSQQARELLVTSQKVADEILRRRNLDAKRQFDSGILMTEQMLEVARKNRESLLSGQPLLLIGETGGAKTALAKHLAREILDLTGKSDKEPEVVSGFAEINTYQLMGKNELREGATEFVPGPLVRAMIEGRPVILDEVNAMPAEILKRLNIIMQLRPGDNYSIQENNGMVVTVAPGFCIIATMNEKSHRYRGVESLSSEFRDRFGVNVAQISYPDQDVPPGSDTLPPTLLQLALAVCTDENTGNIEFKHLDVDKLLKFVRVVHFTQHMYTHPAGEPSFGSYVPSERAVDSASGETGLSKSVISPRTMVQIIDKVEGGNGNISLEEALQDYLGRLDDPTDKAIIQKLLEDYGLTTEKQT